MLALLGAALLAPAHLDLCAYPRLARRSGQEPCWVSYVIGPRARACFPKTLWLDLLARQELPCGTFAGSWSVSSPLLNDARGLLYEARPLKSAHETFLVSQELSRNQGRSAEKIPRHALAWLEQTRERLSESLRGPDVLGVCRHLLLSEGMREDPGGILRVLGFVHLLTATGIHLLALAALWSALLCGLGFGPTLRGVLVGGTLFYAWLLSGGRLGMLLPWGIIAIRALTGRLGWKLGRWTPLVLVTAIAWMCLPSANQNGVLFYAAAVGGGLLGLQLPALPRHLALALGSWAATALLELHTSGILSVATPLLSLVTLPWLSFLVFPALLFSSLPGFAGLAPWIARLSGGILQPMLDASLSLPTLWMISSGGLALGAALALGLLALRNRIAVILGLTVSLLFAAGNFSARHSFEFPPQTSSRARDVEQLDVGQGDAALVIGEDSRAGLIDTGSERALSEQSWLELLASRGIHRLSWIALTHLDEDHSGGLFTLARVTPIGCVETSEAELRTERGKRFEMRLARIGIRARGWGAGCVPFPVHGPAIAKGAGGPRKANANMSALLIPLVGGGNYISMGDADRRDERTFLPWLKSRQEWKGTGPRILKISHHGSETSTEFGFLKELDPDLAWISSGMGNHFDHPRAPVLERISLLGIRTERTDQSGNLDATESLKAEAFRHRPRAHLR